MSTSSDESATSFDPRRSRDERSDVVDVSAEDLRLAPAASYHRLECWFLRWAASLGAPPALFGLRSRIEPQPRSGRLSIEIVSHCWNYSNLLEYQLGSLVAHPPRDVDATLTVYFSRADRRTLQLLELASSRTIPGLRWQWRAVDRPHLFRRAIGRNHAALQSKADWVWFTDCDVLFGEGCLDALGAALQGRVDPLVFPRQEQLTKLLDDSELASDSKPRLRELPAGLEFSTTTRSKAQGPLQIAHGDVARAMGYCRDIKCYQRAEAQWQKTREDSAFRWLLRTDGVPIDVPGVARLRHATKGRYHGPSSYKSLRLGLRRMQQLWRGAGG